jgi:N-acetylmuramoyl-L-alanine amidase
MKKGSLITAIAVVLVLLAIGNSLADSRLIKVRKWSDPNYTRLVLDLEAPPSYEIQSSPNSPILTIYLQKLSLPQGTQEILVEDRIVRKVRLDPAEKEGARVSLFLYQPTQWKVFPLKSSADKPDRLVIDVFKPSVETKEKAEPSAAQPPQAPRAVADKPDRSGVDVSQPDVEKKDRVERPRVQPPLASRTIPEKKEEPPRAITPEEPREKEIAPPKVISKLLDIRQWAAPDHTRVVVDLDGPPSYEVLPPVDPLTHILHLRGISLPKGGQEISVGDRVIQKIKVEPVGREEAKLVLSLMKPSQLNVFLLKPYLDKLDRLVIDVSRPDLEEKERAERQVTRELKAKKKRIVVIDPGHGGDDPGAIGPRKTMEKDIVLALAKNLQKTLDDTGEIRAFLTRRGDYFVSLNDRVKIAQEYGADLFISLHCNGSRSRQTRGSSIFCLSLKGASDKATQLLAQKENASDMVGGTSLAPTQKDLDTILLDLEQTHAINESLQLGGLALNEFGRVNHIQFTQPRQAGFAVLKAPEFPSILVETAYITNPTEEMLLRKKSFQDRICQAITAAVKRYIPLSSAKEGRPGGDSFEGPAKKRGG